MQKKNRLYILFENLKQVKLNRNTLIFGLFLAISAFLWLLNALNKEYSHVIQYPVKFTNIPDDIGLGDDMPAKIGVEIQGHGYDILSYQIDHAKAPVIINLTKTSISKINDEHYYLLDEELIPFAKKRIKGNVKVSDVQPDTLHLYVTKTVRKKLPVKSRIEFTIAGQHMISSGPVFSPDSVELKGPKHIVSKLKHVGTESLNYGKLSNNINRYVPLAPPDKTKSEPSRVKLDIKIEKYTETSFKIPVEVINIPRNIELELIPDDIEISCQVPVSRYEQLSSSSFRLRADYQKAKNNKLYPELVLSPDYVRHIRLHRDNIDFIENKISDK